MKNETINENDDRLSRNSHRNPETATGTDYSKKSPIVKVNSPSFFSFLKRKNKA
jgi:hypothetical protein